MGCVYNSVHTAFSRELRHSFSIEYAGAAGDVWMLSHIERHLRSGRDKNIKPCDGQSLGQWSRFACTTNQENHTL